jgi:hypothetical protein
MALRHLGCNLHRAEVKKVMRASLLDPNVPVAHLRSHPGPDRSCLELGITMPRRPYCKRDANLQHKPDAVGDWTRAYPLAHWMVVFFIYRNHMFGPTGDFLTHRGPKQCKYARYKRKTINSDLQLTNLLVSLADRPQICPK